MMKSIEFEDSQFTCENCGCSMILGYMSPENEGICIFCDTDLDYDDFDNQDGEYDD